MSESESDNHIEQNGEENSPLASPSKELGQEDKADDMDTSESEKEEKPVSQSGPGPGGDASLLEAVTADKLQQDSQGKDDTMDDTKDESDDEEEEAELKPGLLEQPVVLEDGRKRERKKVERMTFAEKSPSSKKKEEDIEGDGEKLGDIARIEHKINTYKADELKPMHKLLYKRNGSSHEIKRNLKRFCGFGFNSESQEYERKMQILARYPIPMLKLFCDILDLEKSGVKEAIMERVMTFLLKPEDSGRPVQKPKRKRSIKQNKPKQQKRRSKKLKEGSEDESGEEEEDKDEEEDEAEEGDSPVKPKKQGTKSKIALIEDGSNTDDSSDEESGEEEEPKKKKARTQSPKKNLVKKETKSPAAKKETKEAAKSETKKPKKKDTPKKAPKKETEKKAPKKEPKKKAAAVDSDSDSSDDEPLATKKKPPTDDEIKEVVKKILEGANLEEITMKTVCKQVYDRYPDYDLSSRKDYIKATVKQIIR